MAGSPLRHDEARLEKAWVCQLRSASVTRTDEEACGDELRAGLHEALAAQIS